VNAVEIAGRYVLERRLGYGGMSTVHLARDTRLERPVAVKLLAEHLADDPTFVSRFQREAQAAARLIHPNIVQVFDSGLDEHTGNHFIVMEYIEGQSGAEILRDRGWMEVPDGVAIIEQACEGLYYAHRHGVVHRDVKPGNLLRSTEGVVKLADFGIAKATEQSSITQVGSVLGTAAYLSPEQARGEEAGPRADIYALGVVAYQLLSGRLPYEATSLTELALKQQREPPAPLDSLVAAVSAELADAIDQALAIDPLDRYHDAREMAHAVSEGAKGRAVVAPIVRTGERESPPTEATSLLASRPAPRERPVSRERAAAPVVTPRSPRTGPPPRRADPRTGQQDVGQRGSSSPGRVIAIIIVILLIVGGIAAAVLASSSSPHQVHLRQVVYNDLTQSVNALEGLIGQNSH
jgi:serine/threonine protein kinase